MAISWFDIGILTVVCALLLIVVIYELVKFIIGIIKKRDKYFIIYRSIALVIPLVLLGLASYYEFRQQYTQYIATVISRRATGLDDITVRCIRGSGEGFDRLTRPLNFHGYVVIGSKYSRIERAVCQDFYSWLMSDKGSASTYQIWALAVTLHEAAHLGGEYNESEANYDATLWFEDAAIYLGANPAEARRMYEYFKNNIIPHQPPQYHEDFEAKEQEKKDAESAESTD